MLGRNGIGLFRVSILFAAFSGCGADMAGGVREIGEPPRGSEKEIAQISADPIAYMRKSLAEAQKVRTARIRFQRQERLGVVPTLQPAEHMTTEFREAPFSVRFTWTSEKPEYVQAVYVDGKNDQRVALLPRVGLFGMKPSIVNYPANYAVVFQKSKKPITDFGPRQMLVRLFDRIEKATAFGGAKIQYAGQAAVGPAEEKCHHIELLFPKGDEYPCKLIDLYVNIDTRLPVACYLWLTEDQRVRTDRTLDAMYIYGDLQPNVALTDADFQIDAVPASRKGGNASGPEKSKKKSVEADGTTHEAKGNPPATKAE